MAWCRHYLNQWWLCSWRIYASLELNELTKCTKKIARSVQFNSCVHNKYRLASKVCRGKNVVNTVTAAAIAPYGARPSADTTITIKQTRFRPVLCWLQLANCISQIASFKLAEGISRTDYCDAIMGRIASQITSLTIVYTTVYSGADQSKHQSFASLAFVWGIHRDRWIPRTKGQLRGKCFHLMTSSCMCGT